MVTVERSVLLAKSADEMFELINDVAAYPQYMNGCEKVEILERSETIMVARLFLKKAGLRQNFTTRNELTRPSSVRLTLVDGPFSKFRGEWTVTELSDQACKVALNLEFVIQSKIAAKALEKMFKAIGDELVDAVCKRAQASSPANSQTTKNNTPHKKL